MVLTIVCVTAWIILPRAARLSVAVLAMIYGFVLAARTRNTERSLLAFVDASENASADFDRKPTRGQRRAMRKSLTLALHQTEFRSLFPDIAHRAQHFVTGNAT